MRVLARLVVCALSGLAACSSHDGSGSSSSGTPGDSGPRSPFSEIELQVLLHELGSLDAEPPGDPTNQYADDARAAALGQKLFFETRYSSGGPSGGVSCATCHIPDKGFQDDRANTSFGIAFTNRHAPSLFNAAYGAAQGDTVWQFWDGRKDSLWAQALAPPENPVEMGSTRAKVALLLYDKYKPDYEAIFGPLPALRDTAGNPLPETDKNKHDITQVFVNFGKAIEAYERKLISRNSRFDQFYEEIATGAATSDKLTARQIAGLKLFIGKGRCISCHLGSNFTDWQFHNTAVSQTGQNLPSEDRGRADGIGQVLRDEFNCASEWSDQPDKSRCEVKALTAAALDGGAAASAIGAFKTPSLRAVSSTAPYFHTGELKTLADVISFYDRGGDSSGFIGTRDEDIQKLELSDEEQQLLVEFLNSLDGQALDVSLTTAPALPD